MQLWKKNYLAAYILFLVILNLSMLLLAAMGFKNDLETRMNDVIKRQQQFAYTVEGLMGSEDGEEKLLYLGQGYYRNRTYINVSRGERTVVNHLPAGVGIMGNADIFREIIRLIWMILRQLWIRKNVPDWRMKMIIQ